MCVFGIHASSLQRSERRKKEKKGNEISYINSLTAPYHLTASPKNSRLTPQMLSPYAPNVLTEQEASI